MSQSKFITAVLNDTMDAIAKVIPIEGRPGRPSLMMEPFVQHEMSVLLGVVGELSGRLVIEADTATFVGIGQHMFGEILDGEMLESFVGELGNMVAGNMASGLSDHGIRINISPPTVLVGPTKLGGLEKGILVPISLREVGEMRMLISVESDASSQSN